MNRLLFLLFALAFVACQSKKSETEEATEGEAVETEIKSIPPLHALDPATQKQMDNVLAAYFNLKETFVRSDSALAVKEAQSLPAMLDEVQKKNLNAAAQKDFDNYSQELRKQIAVIQSTYSLEEQRRAFSNLSQTMHAMLVAFGCSEKAYWDYCPMAFHDEGAYWLSRSEEINNPYFGNEMLHCGRVKEVFEQP